MVYPLVLHFLYPRHIHKNILVTCKKWFDNETRKIFLRVWHFILYTSIEKVFYEN